jgi:hypothetical protein
MMIFLAVVGGIIILAIALAVVYDHRARRRGWRVGPSTGEAFQNRLDVTASESPMLQGSKQDWMTHRQRDRKPADQ